MQRANLEDLQQRINAITDLGSLMSPKSYWQWCGHTDEIMMCNFEQSRCLFVPIASREIREFEVQNRQMKQLFLSADSKCLMVLYNDQTNHKYHLYRVEDFQLLGKQAFEKDRSTRFKIPKTWLNPSNGHSSGHLNISFKMFKIMYEYPVPPPLNMHNFLMQVQSNTIAYISPFTLDSGPHTEDLLTMLEVETYVFNASTRTMYRNFHCNLEIERKVLALLQLDFKRHKRTRFLTYRQDSCAFQPFLFRQHSYLLLSH